MTDTSTITKRVSELERDLEEERQTRRRLFEVATLLNSTLNLDELLQIVMRSAAELLNAETSSLMLLDEETNELVISIATGDVASEVVKQRVPAGKGIAGWVLEHREPAIVEDPSSDDRFYTEVGEKIGYETENLLAVPLLVKDRPMGVVEVINKQGRANFTDSDLETAKALASLAAIAIDNAGMYARLADAVVQARMSYRL